MSLKPETRFKIRLRQKLVLVPRSHWTKVQMKSLRGIPDLLGCVNGHHVALELKVDSPVDSLQVYELSCIARAGGYVAVLTPTNQDAVLMELTFLSLASTPAGVSKVVQAARTRLLEEYGSLLSCP